jgi:hypothetical protein
MLKPPIRFDPMTKEKKGGVCAREEIRGEDV